MNIESGYVPITGGRLYYEVAGTGHPLLLIHAGVADTRMWDEQFAFFAQNSRVIRFDVRGFGKTSSADGTFSDTQDIAALLKHLGVERVAVMGLSNGGRIAIDTALAFPERVDALVAVAAAISGQDIPLTAMPEDEQRLFTEYERLESQEDKTELTEFEVRVWVDGPMQPEGRADARVRDRVREMIADNYRLHHEQLKREKLTPPSVERLAEIQVPTLVILGDLDFSDVGIAMNLLAEQVPGAQKVVIPNTAHMVNMEQPATFNSVVSEFLARLPK